MVESIVVGHVRATRQSVLSFALETTRYEALVTLTSVRGHIVPAQ